MEWRDRGVVLGGRAHGEAGVILDLLTMDHGRHVGLVQGGRSRRLRPVLQPGNTVLAVWRARLDQQLGGYSVEALRLRGADVMSAAAPLHAVHHLCGLARLLPEREPQPVLHAMMEAMMDNIADGAALPPQMVQFELAVLAALGFGLDLTCCAVTGSTEDLAYVSPKSGRAVCSSAAGPYAGRLLTLPSFLRPDRASADISPADLLAAFRMIDHFMARDVFTPRAAEPGTSRRAYLIAVGLLSGSGRPG